MPGGLQVTMSEYSHDYQIIPRDLTEPCAGPRAVRVTRVYLVHEAGVGHQHSEVDIDRSDHSTLQLVFSEFHRVHIVKFQD